MSFPQIELYIGGILADKQYDAVLEAAMRWVSHNPSNRLEDLAVILDHVNVDKCSVECISRIRRRYQALINDHCKLRVDSFSIRPMQMIGSSVHYRWS